MSMQVHDDIFDKAIAEAKKSTMLHKHGTVITRNGEIVATGHNRVQDFMSHAFSLHSECDALMKLRGKPRRFMEECWMVVVRIGPQSTGYQYKLSKPCPKCSREIEKSGIKKVFYSIDASSPL